MKKEDILKILEEAESNLSNISDAQIIQLSDRATKGGKKGGVTLYKKKKGIFARTEEEIKRDCSEGGTVSGNLYDGVFLKKWAEENPELAFEQNSKIGKEQGAKNVESGHLAKVRITGGKTSSEIEYKCSKCGKVVSGAVYHRWHGDNCKELEKINEQLSIISKLDKNEFNSNELVELCKTIGYNYKNIKYGILKNTNYIEQMCIGTNQTNPSVFRLKNINK